VLDAVDLHEHLVEVLSPTGGANPAQQPHSILGGKHRTRAQPAEAHRLVAHLAAPLVEEVLHVP
jgi:hypothetical protein